MEGLAKIVDSFSAAVKDNGLTAVLIVVILLAAFYIIIWNKKLVDTLVGVQAKMTQHQNDTIHRNTVSMDANTGSNLKLVSTVDRLASALGSDPTRVCQLANKLKSQGFDDETIDKAIRRFMKNHVSEEPTPS